ncbi:Ankyrin repeat and protein kinase domain-containing protein 1 [Smittium culicis]|uniref:Ankyrin repeat and protein kinase domain-containing protein 1 n=1 Tax=Smittium culicis TaxID=133412 RepID=A0A1R1WZD7_9FUNG|nr:Ankyrin repeat and protein kinase domain-containing protein 1 [Smittium culicis]
MSDILDIETDFFSAADTDVADSDWFEDQQIPSATDSVSVEKMSTIPIHSEGITDSFVASTLTKEDSLQIPNQDFDSINKNKKSFKKNRSLSLDRVPKKKKKSAIREEDWFSGSSLSSLNDFGSPSELESQDESELSDLSDWSDSKNSDTDNLKFSSNKDLSSLPKSKSAKSKKSDDTLYSKKSNPPKTSQTNNPNSGLDFTDNKASDKAHSESNFRIRRRPGRRRKVYLDQPNRKDEQGRPQILYFASRGDFDSCKKLVSHGASINAKDLRGWTLYHEAARQGNTDLGKFILQVSDSTNIKTKYLDINSQCSNGNTPLHEAVKYNNPEFVVFLLYNGARMDIKNSLGHTPLDICNNQSSLELLESSLLELRSALTCDKAGQTRLHRACSSGDYDKVLKQLNIGVEIDLPDNAGWTPLHEASLAGHTSIVRELLRRGASTTGKGFGDDTPLHDACANGHIEVVKLLLKSNADINAKNSNGLTPFEITTDDEIKNLITDWRKNSPPSHSENENNNENESSESNLSQPNKSFAKKKKKQILYKSLNAKYRRPKIINESDYSEPEGPKSPENLKRFTSKNLKLYKKMSTFFKLPSTDKRKPKPTSSKKKKRIHDNSDLEYSSESESLKPRNVNLDSKSKIKKASNSSSPVKSSPKDDDSEKVNFYYSSSTPRISREERKLKSILSTLAKIEQRKGNQRINSLPSPIKRKDKISSSYSKGNNTKKFDSLDYKRNKTKSENDENDSFSSIPPKKTASTPSNSTIPEVAPIIVKRRRGRPPKDRTLYLPTPTSSRVGDNSSNSNISKHTHNNDSNNNSTPLKNTHVHTSDNTSKDRSVPTEINAQNDATSDISYKSPIPVPIFNYNENLTFLDSKSSSSAKPLVEEQDETQISEQKSSLENSQRNSTASSPKKNKYDNNETSLRNRHKDGKPASKVDATSSISEGSIFNQNGLGINKDSAHEDKDSSVSSTLSTSSTLPENQGQPHKPTLDINYRFLHPLIFKSISENKDMYYITDLQVFLYINTLFYHLSKISSANDHDSLNSDFNKFSERLVNDTTVCLSDLQKTELYKIFARNPSEKMYVDENSMPSHLRVLESESSFSSFRINFISFNRVLEFFTGVFGPGVVSLFKSSVIKLVSIRSSELSSLSDLNLSLSSFKPANSSSSEMMINFIDKSSISYDLENINVEKTIEEIKKVLFEIPKPDKPSGIEYVTSEIKNSARLSAIMNTACNPSSEIFASQEIKNNHLGLGLKICSVPQNTNLPQRNMSQNNSPCSIILNDGIFYSKKRELVGLDFTSNKSKCFKMIPRKYSAKLLYSGDKLYTF